MSESRSLEIRNEADVINARLQTRQMAKDAGLSIMDQARISLAVSSLAHLIRLGDGYQGQIVLNRVSDGTRSGLQVLWKIASAPDFETILKDLHNSTLYMMVHELNAQATRETGVCVTGVMWNMPLAREMREGNA